MHLLKHLFSFSLIILSFSSFSQIKTINNVDFKESVEINNEVTNLNGGGLREKYGFMDLYVGGLYLEKKSSNENDIIMADANMGIRIIIVSGLVTRDRFIDALEDGFENSTSGISTNDDVVKFKKYLNDPFVEGDEIVLNYHKGEGVHLYKNGKERGVFNGLPFKQALFGIWLGGKPADQDLKEGMLGL